MNFSPKNCCRLCAKAHKHDDVNVIHDSELGTSIKALYGIDMESPGLSTFVCCDCRVSTIAFSANFDRVQYIQGQLKKYASMSTSNDNTEKPKKDLSKLPALQSLKPKRSTKNTTTLPYNKTEMTMKLGDRVKFVSYGKMVHGVIDGLFSKQGKYQIKTSEGEILKIFHLAVIRDEDF